VPLDGRGGTSGDPVREIASTVREMNAQFSPDGRRIVFESLRSGTHEIWLADRGGANASQLTAFNGRRGGIPAWSPDGQSIVYDLRADGPGDIFVVAARGGAERRLTADPLDDLIPSWSRDGRWVYFASRRTGRFEVWKVSPDGGEPVQVTTDGGGYPKESQDGRMLYYSTVAGPALPSLWRVPAAGGKSEQVIAELAAFLNFALTSEGIYFEPPSPGLIRGHDMLSSRLGQRGSRIDYFSFATGRTTTVLRLPGSLGNGMDVSPDGRSLLYAQTESIADDLMLVEGFQ
jgi:Tol biopolymer transport system component